MLKILYLKYFKSATYISGNTVTQRNMEHSVTPECWHNATLLRKKKKQSLKSAILKEHNLKNKCIIKHKFKECKKTYHLQLAGLVPFSHHIYCIHWSTAIETYPEGPKPKRWQGPPCNMQIFSWHFKSNTKIKKYK